jgi:hypothetical protein
MLITGPMSPLAHRVVLRRRAILVAKGEKRA